MAPVISFQPTATTPNSQPSLPRSGACAAPLPPAHSHDVILFGGYTEQQQPSIQRDPTNEAWLFSKASGSWIPVKYSSEAVPCTRLVAQCVVVGNKLWLIGKGIWLMHSLQDNSHCVAQACAAAVHHHKFSIYACVIQHTATTVPSVSGCVPVLVAVAVPAAIDIKLSSLQHCCRNSAVDRLTTRACMACVVVDASGGWDSSKTGPEAFLGDVWTLDLTTWAWEQQQPAGEDLQGISRFQAVADGTRILIHTHRCDDHILALHTDSSPPRLEKVPVKGPAPSSRGLHSVVKVGGALYLYGGAPQKGPMLDDLWKLELSSMQWQQLQPQGQIPHARCSPAAAAVGKYIVYFGGAFYGASGGLEMLQDVVLYDTEGSSWVVPEVAAPHGSSNAELPAGRNAAVMVPLADEGAEGPQLLLAGGWRAFVETYNDTYLVKLQ